jgi:hypothetical protein
MARAFHLEASMVFESVEISTPAEESPAVSWPAIAAGAIAAAALTLVLLAFGAGMGFSAVTSLLRTRETADLESPSTASDRARQIPIECELCASPLRSEWHPLAQLPFEFQLS